MSGETLGAARPPAFGHRRYVVASRAIPYAMVAFGLPTSLEQAQAEAAEAEAVGKYQAGVFELRLVKHTTLPFARKEQAS